MTCTQVGLVLYVAVLVCRCCINMGTDLMPPLSPPAGNSSYLQRSNESMYTKTPTTDLKLGWYIGSGYACSAALRAICEIPESVYACPVTTPPQAAPASADSVCEQPAAFLVVEM